MINSLDNLAEQNAALEVRFAEQLVVNTRLNRQLVSFQANKHKPAYRWFKYKEGFSEALIQYLLDEVGIEMGRILDPFAGTGTALFAAAERGFDATGIELLPVGCEIVDVRKLALDGDATELCAALDRWRDKQPWKDYPTGRTFPHLRITAGAFPPVTEEGISRYLAVLETESGAAKRLLHFALMCVLETVSYTRKDGQYLRWDYRSGRRQGNKPFDKGYIPSFEEAICEKLNEIRADLQPSGFLPGFFEQTVAKGAVEVRRGSCLHILPTLNTACFDGVITSPPYANRYDYTRTYALELALLGVDENAIRELRQAMVACTVENRAKAGLEETFSASIYRQARLAFEGQAQLQAILAYLEWQKETRALNNAGIPRMVRNYFFEMALVIFDCARLLKPGAPLVMVNDNVRYGGAIIPVDLILSDFAEQAGFEVEVIWVLPTGKGNSSQQMGAHGREEARKCIYLWRRKH
jgi:DNA modification methylase